ncbi:LysR family transcriptional regulator [Pseudomonas brassicacearum]|uniref:LysR family transcriptional regulator n=1 Tax=Pseudomonas brassicacearum TaxID=930166 RepID=UPI00087C083C|nr:LysR family transcriptional regulator [Pseudomonas brassicacearum]NJP59333.1 LysR family transcriptional regulator [Pseudomonas brassicacearum]SDP23798.1 DNA-binding transcriptional regulator, LysR family [Pseudomonas brassicacearum]
MNTPSVPPLHDIDLKHWRLFKAVVECGGLSAAEEATGMGISAISRQLSDLESRFGSQLCHRGRSGFQLTQEGQVAYTAILRLLDSIDEFRETLASSKGEVKGDLSLWLIDHCTFAPSNPIAAALQSFCTRYPLVNLSIGVAPPDAVERAVAEKKAGVGITICKSDFPSLTYQVIGREASALYCGRNHEAFGKSEEKARQIVEQTARYVRRGYLVQDTAPASFLQNSNTLAHHIEGTVQLLLSGGFVGIVPDHIAQPWVESGALYRLPLPEFMVERPVFVITRESQGASRTASLMQDAIMDAFRLTQN